MELKPSQRRRLAMAIERANRARAKAAAKHKKASLWQKIRAFFL